MEQVSVDILKELLTWMQAGRSFAMDQAPMVAREILVSGIIFHTLLLLPSVSLVGLFSWGFRWAFKTDEPEFVIFSGTMGMISLLVSISSIYHLLVIWLAPRYYLFGYIRTLVK